MSKTERSLKDLSVELLACLIFKFLRNECVLILCTISTKTALLTVTHRFFERRLRFDHVTALYHRITLYSTHCDLIREPQRSSRMKATASNNRRSSDDSLLVLGLGFLAYSLHYNWLIVSWFFKAHSDIAQC